MTSDERWLAELWPVVRDPMPGPPGAVIEIGCGSVGGFVPMLRSAGYDAIGVDPRAPEGPWYQQVEFEAYQPPEPALAVVACTSLHHTADVGTVLALAHAALTAAGSIVALLDYGPYFFAELADVSQADEQAAIDAGQIQANRIGYVGRRS